MGPGTFELDADISALGMAFIEVLKLRQSQRDFSERELSWAPAVAPAVGRRWLQPPRHGPSNGAIGLQCAGN